MFIIDTRREHIAVKEARKLGVKTIALIDTDSDPDQIDLPIPGNDDAMRAIEIICKELADSAIEGKTGRSEQRGEGDAPAGAPRRRSTRSAFRAEGGEVPAPAAIPAESTNPAAPVAPTEPVASA
jgi:small subunit ribosomal protein S2